MESSLLSVRSSSTAAAALERKLEYSKKKDNVSYTASDVASQDLNTPLAISTAYLVCLSKFNVLISSLQHGPTAAQAQDLKSRLQIWAGNHGAHRSQSDRLSLDYRLRESLELHQEVRDHFDDLIHAMEDAISSVSSSEPTAHLGSSYDSSSSSDSEPSLTGSQKALIGVLSFQPKRNKAITPHILLETIRDIINSLYKFSITIQNPAHRDRTARAAKIDMSFWDEIDLRHVRDKFPKCSNLRLLRDLAQANTKRRQLFAYHKRHKDKIQHFREHPVNVPSAVESEQLPGVFDDKPAIATPAAAPTIHTGNTKLADTTVSMIKAPLATIAVSMSGRSQRTHITNTPMSTYKDELVIPPPPGDANDFDAPFICPYCFSTIDPRDETDWRIHVFDDLRPYICTFGDCVSATVLYHRSSEWSTHELEVHRREWFCNYCNTTCAAKRDFVEHLNLQHMTLIGGEHQLESLATLCERTSTRDEDCPP
ncbi:hypothetical protein EG329_003693 [Mollisiaceae sp. DMI_Dod_QoI]|nr:hypothetical protein EG329_003693 [Helotiales sp. DMI_Dod_QoI]